MGEMYRQQYIIFGSQRPSSFHKIKRLNINDSASFIINRGVQMPAYNILDIMCINIVLIAQCMSKVQLQNEYAHLCLNSLLSQA